MFLLLCADWPSLIRASVVALWSLCHLFPRSSYRGSDWSRATRNGRHCARWWRRPDNSAILPRKGSLMSPAIKFRHRVFSNSKLRTSEFGARTVAGERRVVHFRVFSNFNFRSSFARLSSVDSFFVQGSAGRGGKKKGRV